MFSGELSPRPELGQLESVGGLKFWVLRDDKLLGGTKQRAAQHYVRIEMEKGKQTFCYASPFAGFAQVALAVCCQALKVDCVIFAERDQTVGETQAHAFSKLAQSFGAELYLFSDLKTAHEAATRYASQADDRLNIPLGFDSPVFNHFLQVEIGKIWTEVCCSAGEIERVWLPVGSGTLTRAVRRVFPSHVRLECLNVHVLPSSDHRIASLSGLPNTSLRSVPEKFAEGPSVEAPLPSNRHYDAKLWNFLRQEAQPNDLWWNVAR